MDTGHIKPLTSLRGIAALYVLFHHLLVYYFKDVGQGLSEYTLLIHNGYLWVDFFFILSGFLLALLYHAGIADKSLPVSHFLVRRFARIYPLHLVVLLAFFVLQLAFYLKGDADAFSNRFSLSELLRSVLLVHAVQLDPQFTPWNGPSWSISAEWCAYLLFPWLVILVFNLRGRLAAGLFWLFSFAALGLIDAATPHQLDLTGYLGLMRCFLEFSMGIMLCSTVYRSEQMGKWLARTGFQVLLFLGLFLSLHFDGVDVISVMLMVLVIVSVSYRETPVTRFLSHPWLFYLGSISYSVYMIHWFVFTFVDQAAQFLLGMDVRVFETPAGYVTVGLVCLLLVLVSSVVSFHLIEEPLRKRIPRLLGMS